MQHANLVQLFMQPHVNPAQKHVYSLGVEASDLRINDIPWVLQQSGGSHLQHANLVQLFIHTHVHPTQKQESLSNHIRIRLESQAFKCAKNSSNLMGFVKIPQLRWLDVSH